MNSTLSRYLQGRIKDLGDGFITEINAMNHILTFMRFLALDQANLHPEDADAANHAAQDLKLLATPPVTADVNTIRSLFMRIVRDIKKNAASNAEDRQLVTTEVLDHPHSNLTKGSFLCFPWKLVVLCL